MSNNCLSMSFPSTIYRGTGAVSKIGEIADVLGKRVFIIGGHKALEASMPLMEEQLQNLEVVETAWYGGECSKQNFQMLTEKIQSHNVDFIIVVGGGKALDTGKVVAIDLGIPFAAIPTIAATCAAVATTSVIYDDKGHYLDSWKLSKAPDYVIIDPQIIAKAPLKWLSAGLGDTLAKFYEYRVICGGKPDGSLNMAAFNNGQLCFNVISRYADEACKGVIQGKSTFALEQVMDAIFIYAGFTSIMGIGNHLAAAHGLYNGFTVNDKVRHFGHGLLVGYGNLCLLALENRQDSEIVEAIKLAKSCGVPTSLAEIADLSDAELNEVVDASVNNPNIKSMPFDVSHQDLLNAIGRVNQLSDTLK
ncbi:iron-containing alcohol dehydrogenase family protein [Vibrio sonorensis]|uniref:iron-containing alcohol dehydrogenase family protein n=1 Tax=Vibrio sonorensis TaxID=1004316 RepID=UPI0008D94ADC|nr:iron-containing alcohol dehydrogenase family protein [Vibrio sonorensis]